MAPLDAATLDDIPLADARAQQVALSICRRVAEVGGRAQYVGGVVRDALDGRVPHEVDIEVFGIEPHELRHLVERIVPVSLVGASFGVLKVHSLPIDVSVPRRERKAGTGHRGFEVDADPWLDPAQAAARRDFTINAIGWDPLTHALFDPFDGIVDLRRRVLRHTSPQFVEDPLRVLRGMQFVARFDVTPAPETVALCRTIHDEGLAAERVFDEWSKLILRGTAISAGLAFLRDTGWLRYTPELEALVDCPQDPEWHPEGDVWTHTGHVMDQFASRRVGANREQDREVGREVGREVDRESDRDWENLVVGFGCLCHDLGKPATTVLKDGRWRSPGHEEAGVAPTRSLLGRMTSQVKLIDEVVPLVADHLKPDQLFQGGASPAAVRRLARRVGRLDRLLRVARADRDGRPPSPTDDFPAARWLEETARELDVSDKPPRPMVMGRHLLELGLAPGPTFGPLLEEIFEAQLDGRVSTVEQGLDLARQLLAGRTAD